MLPGTTVTPAYAADTDVYWDSLGSSWENWSWSSSVNLGATPAYSGSKAISWKPTSGGGALRFHNRNGVQTSSTSQVQFALRASESDQRLKLVIIGANNQTYGSKLLSEVGGTPPAGSWKYYSINLSLLNAASKTVYSFYLQEAENWAQPTVLVDNVKLTSTGTSSESSTTTDSSIPWYPEIRPNNKTANYTLGRPTNKSLSVDWRFRPYYEKINGNYTGTTEQILEWAAKKWGFADLGYTDIAKAIAAKESWWNMSQLGDEGRSVGIMQTKTTYWPDSAYARYSTAYSADYGMAILRFFYDGNSWIGAGAKGMRNAVGAYYCGCGYDGYGAYANKVFEYYNAKIWKKPGTSPYWF